VAGRPAAASAWQRALAGQRTAARSRGLRHRCLALEVGMAKLEGIEAVTTYVLRHRPKSSNADALHRPLRIRQNLWQSMLGKAVHNMPRNQNTWEGFHVLHAPSFAPVPNLAFNADADTPQASDTPYGRRLTLALGLF
jgi:hypothetical protein